MASVSSLDRDVKNLRSSKYTPAAANEARTWIEGALGQRLKPGDLMEALKDGVALCKLVNLVNPGMIKYKDSSMPFTQMENISLFLRACQAPPFNLHSHDIFQTVALYESKDPAQVLQCIGAFSRSAHAAQPTKIPDMIGEKGKGGVLTPQGTGSRIAGTSSPQFGRARGTSNVSDGSSITSSQPSYISGRTSPLKSSTPTASTFSSSINGTTKTPTSPSGGISSWSKKDDEGKTIPAWNIHQYGYMGGASQGNQGIAFGARRQITTPAPKVPSLAEKERKRREDAERAQKEAEEAEAKRVAKQEAEEERARLEEERRWESETQKQRELERQRVEEEKRQWDEEQRRWRAEEEARLKEEREAEARVAREQEQRRKAGLNPLTGQYLSQYQAGHRGDASNEENARSKEQQRIEELEQQLEQARLREADYNRDRQGRPQDDIERQERSRSRPAESPRRRNQSRSRSRPRPLPSLQSRVQQELRDEPQEEDSSADQYEPLQLKIKTDGAADDEPGPPSPRPLPVPQASRPMAAQPAPSPSPPFPDATSYSTRPLPNPSTYNVPSPSTSPQRRSPFARPPPSTSPHPPRNTAAAITAPAVRGPSPSLVPAGPYPHHPPSPTRDTNANISTSSNKLRKPPFANPSTVLSREMELERQRQKEWEDAQQASSSLARDDNSARPGGGAWDTSQYGFMGGDSQNRGGPGIGFGMGRRQLVGPRDPPPPRRDG